MTKLALTLFVAIPFLACATVEKPKVASKTTATDAPKVAAAPATPAPGGSVRTGLSAPASPIYFQFDSDELTSDSQKTLQLMAAYLQENPKAVLTVEGHCDETGSGEYNLALGDRRARAARDYLKKLGVEDTRLKSISYGEEKPAVAGDDEKNRRGQFDLNVSG